jgi:5-methylthioadenosine/S-adenosylhomocysteine deaminase
MDQMAASGTHAVHCPGSNLKLASGHAPRVEMRRRGVSVSLGADGAPCNNRMDPFTELRQAALLAKARQADATAMSAREALSLLTAEGAKVLGRVNDLGSLEAGKLADLVVVDLQGPHVNPGLDPVSQIVYSATASDVRHVVVGGRVLVDSRRLLTLDIDEVIDDARRERARTAARAGLG